MHQIFADRCQIGLTQTSSPNDRVNGVKMRRKGSSGANVGAGGGVTISNQITVTM